MKCGMRMKKQLSIERVDECRASFGLRIKRRAMKQSVTKGVNVTPAHRTTSTGVATLQIRPIAIMPSSGRQQRLCALPCCRQAIISHQDTTVLLQTCCSLQSVILQYINTKLNNAYINAIRNLIKRITQHNFHFIHP